MSIVPEGGGVDPSQQNAQQRPYCPPQPPYSPRSSYVTCKVCDRGTLSSKTKFRMSGPVVAIGFILLVPSVLGMVFSAFVLFGFNAHNGGESSTSTILPRHLFQSDFDASFRRTCAQTARQLPVMAGSPTRRIEQYCECLLSAYKETGSERAAAQMCVERAKNGTLEQPSKDVDAFYSDDTPATTIEPSRPFQSDSDANFRKSCAMAVRTKNQEVGYYATQQQIERYCECALSTFKETGSEKTASQMCLQKSNDGTLEQPSHDVDAFYSSDTPTESGAGAVENGFRALGSLFAVVLGISSFVGGLLGWLLVMRKRVLQCNVCSAVVNAS